MIYLDAASTSLQKPPAVALAMAEALGSLGNPGRGVHFHAKSASDCVYQGRKAVAALFGCAPGQVAFTSGATEALNIAIGGLLKPTGHVITTVLEHNAVLRPLFHLEAQGMGLSVIGLKDGNLDYAAFENAVKPNTKAVVITFASNVTGLVVDMKQVAAFCKKHGLLLIVDGAQAAGALPIHMGEMGIDVLCFTAHKSLYGPQGIGGLCVAPHVKVAPVKFGGSGSNSFDKTQPTEMPDALEAGTLNAHGIAGLMAGVGYIGEKGMDSLFGKGQALAAQFYEGVSAIFGVKIYSLFHLPHTPVVALNIGDMDSGAVEDLLSREYGICARGGAHCAPLLHRALGTEKQGAVRFSFSSFNTAEEVTRAVEAVADISKDIALEIAPEQAHG